MNRRSRQACVILRFATTVILVMTALGCTKTGKAVRVDSAGDLMRAVDTADQITVTQHSYRYDAYDSKEAESYRQVTYAVKELSPRQRKHLSGIVGALPAGIPDAAPACIFNPHHTFRFFEQGKLTSKLQVCFECPQVRWDGSDKELVTALHGELRAYVAWIGMHPDANWHALAKQYGAIK